MGKREIGQEIARIDSQMAVQVHLLASAAYQASVAVECEPSSPLGPAMTLANAATVFITRFLEAAKARTALEREALI